MSEHHGLKHTVFGQLLCLRLDHQHAFLRTSNDQVQGRTLHLVEGRVQIQLALNLTNAHTADGAEERQA